MAWRLNAGIKFIMYAFLYFSQLVMYILNVENIWKPKTETGFRLNQWTCYELLNMVFPLLYFGYKPRTMWNVTLEYVASDNILNRLAVLQSTSLNSHEKSLNFCANYPHVKISTNKPMECGCVPTNCSN